MKELNYTNLAIKKRIILGPLGRFLMKLFRWEIKEVKNMTELQNRKLYISE